MTEIDLLSRGQRVDNNEWVIGYYVFNKFLGATITTEDERVEVNQESVGRFTGRIDKNGIYIFEGHIIKTFIGFIYEVENMIDFALWIERQFLGCPELTICGNIIDINTDN